MLALLAWVQILVWSLDTLEPHHVTPGRNSAKPQETSG